MKGTGQQLILAHFVVCTLGSGASFYEALILPEEKRSVALAFCFGGFFFLGLAALSIILLVAAPRR